MADSLSTRGPIAQGQARRVEADDRTRLREVYADLATGVVTAAGPGCACVPRSAAATCATGGPTEAVYLARGFVGPLLGSGNPLAMAALQPGETVLDLGSGAGMDCFLAARQVGDSGHVIGVDMTVEMVETARANLARAAVENVEFRLGEIEHLPADRAQVFREAWRVLRAGGRLVVSDVMLDGPVPEALRAALGDAAGSLVEERDYLAAVRSAGFVGVTLERAYPDPGLASEDLDRVGAERGARAVAVVRMGETGQTRTIRLEESDAKVAGRSFSGGLRARKPNSE